jgi:putative transposase
MNKIDEQFTKTPFYGSRKMARQLSKNLGKSISRKRIQRLMRIMGLEAIYPKPNTSRANPEHRKYPYLLRNLELTGINQVWSTDITYVRLEGGFAYLTAIIDWFSRKVIAWRLSNTMDTSFCLEALKEALKTGQPSIFNTDQGSQFTSAEFTGILLEADIAISMDGRGRALDNIFVERLWRTVKYENIFLKGYQTMEEARLGLTDYFKFYNEERLHEALAYETPNEVHYALAA